MISTVVLSTIGVIRVHRHGYCTEEYSRLFAVPCNPIAFLVYLTCAVRYKTPRTRAVCKTCHRRPTLSHDRCHVAPLQLYLSWVG